MRCLECGAEIAERAQVCARCGSWAPAEYQLYVAEDRAADVAHDAAGGLAPTAIDASDPDGWKPAPLADADRARALAAFRADIAGEDKDLRFADRDIRVASAEHATAMYNLGVLLEDSDPDQARCWFEKAAEAGAALPEID